MDENTEQVIDQMGLVFGLLTARHNDDKAGFYSLLGGDGDGKSDPDITTHAFLGMTDFALSCLKIQSELTGMKVSTLLQTLSMISNIALPEIIEKRERGY